MGWIKIPLKVDKEKCDGCGICVEMCPLDVIRLDGEKKAYMKYEECCYCGCCEIECPRNAVIVELPYLLR